MTELEERLDLAVAIALEASAVPMRYYLNDGLVIDRKADDSPVTRADKEAEELLRKRLDERAPNDAIVGEEYDDKAGTSGYQWIVDPIDGTESFIRGVPLFGTMVALTHNDVPVAGAIAFPALNEIIYAASGHGSWWAVGTSGARATSDLAKRQARVSSIGELSIAAASTTGLAHAFEEAEIAEQWRSLLSKVNVARGFSDCYGHYLVATGRMDIMLDPLMNVWDNAPLLPIVEEAGGRFTDIRGNAVIDGGSGLSTNGLLHDAVLAVLNG